MDHTKIVIPSKQRITKATSGLGQIPIFVTGMLIHGHRDGTYAHYSTAVWLASSNFTISSLCWVLRALKRPLVKQSKELFWTPPQNSFFEALLYGKFQCSSSIPSLEGCDYIPTPSPGCLAVSLSKRLFLQLDNSTKDNKNRFVMAFYLLLITRGFFKEVTVGIVIVEHAHENEGLHGLAIDISLYSKACLGSC